MKRHWAYFKYVMRHKWFVFLAGLKIHPPKRWQWPFWIVTLILHDWDKFLPFMWFSYAATFYHPDGTKKYEETERFAQAWSAHQKRNKHHWQAWLLTWDRGETQALPVPQYYMLEMLADWYGAGRAILGIKSNTPDWYEKNKTKMILHDISRQYIESALLLKICE